MNTQKYRISSLAFGLLFAVGARAELTCDNIPDFMRSFALRHVKNQRIDADIQNRSVDQYIKRLDPSKTLLLESEVQVIRKDLSTLYSLMPRNQCTPLVTTQDVVIRKAEQALTFVQQMLGANFKLDESLEIHLDAEKKPHPKTQAEWEDGLRRNVHFQVSNLLSMDIKLADAKKQLVHRYELLVKRLKERRGSDKAKLEDLYAAFLDSFANSLDPHSTYLSRRQLEDFQIQMNLSLDGIGATLSSQDGYTVVEEIVAGGAADRAKVLKPQDKIIAVAQDGKDPVSAIDMDLSDVVAMIRGKKGTKVHLTLLRKAGNDTATLKVSIVRDKIDLKEQAAKLTIQEMKVGERKLNLGVIDLPSFYGNTETKEKLSSDDVKRLISEAKAKKADGLVLDLSRNGGGLLDDAVVIAGLFMGQGAMVGTRDSRGRVSILQDQDPAVLWNGPLVVLISRRSASASEIVAGAIKDYKRGVVVGDNHTFGKGTVQAVMYVPDNSGAIKVTTQMFFRPGGKSTQHAGVDADIVVPSVFNFDEIGEKSLPYSLPQDQMPPFLSAGVNPKDLKVGYKPVTVQTLQDLMNKSKQRIEKDPKFLEIKKDLEEAAKNRGTIKIADIRKKEAENKKKSKTDESKSAKDKEKDEEKVQLQEALKILGDLIISG